MLATLLALYSFVYPSSSSIALVNAMIVYMREESQHELSEATSCREARELCFSSPTTALRLFFPFYFCFANKYNMFSREVRGYVEFAFGLVLQIFDILYII